MSLFRVNAPIWVSVVILALSGCGDDEHNYRYENGYEYDEKNLAEAEVDKYAEATHLFSLTGLPLKMPYSVAGGANSPARLGMPFGSETYDWHNLKPENQYVLIRSCAVWDKKGIPHKFHGYHKDTNTIHDETQFREWVRNNKGKTWVMGNELDVASHGNTKPEANARMYKKYKDVIKSEDPSAKLATGSLGGLKGNESFATQKVYYEKFINAYKAQNGKPPPIDVWNTHFYAREPGDVGWVAGEFDKFVKWLRSIEGGKYKSSEVVITEFGMYGYHSSDTMIKYMHDILDRFENRVASGNLDRFFWFVGGYCDCEGWTSSSLFGPDKRPSPLGEAYAKRAHQWLNKQLANNKLLIYQHYARGGRLYSLTDGYNKWEDSTDNLPYANLGPITGFNSFEHPGGYMVQHMIRGGKMFARDSKDGWSQWKDVTDNIQKFGTGAPTGFNSFVKPDGVIVQHMAKGGRLFSRNNKNGWNKWDDVTKYVSKIGSGTITGFSSTVLPNSGGVISQHFVRGGRIYYRDNRGGFKDDWTDITGNYAAGNGEFTDFNSFTKTMR